MISCEQAATICNKAQYSEASRKERWQLWMHLVVCKTCTRFSRKNKQLTQLCEKASLSGFTPQEKAALKERMKQS